MKREQLHYLWDNLFNTQRFSHCVGWRCRQATIKDIADELKLNWDTVKTLEKQYMRAQLAKAGTPEPKVIGMDEISIRKGHIRVEKFEFQFIGYRVSIGNVFLGGHVTRPLHPQKRLKLEDPSRRRLSLARQIIEGKR